MRFLALLFALLPLEALATDVTTVILVRHAEKMVVTHQDPALSEAGAARATELARVLADVPIDAIYVTHYLRTHETAGPIAKARGLEPIKTKASATYAAELAKTIREKHRGQTVLVVGHTNSTVSVMRELGVENPPEIAETRYDDLFICTVSEGKTRMLPLRYGAPVR